MPGGQDDDDWWSCGRRLLSGKCHLQNFGPSFFILQDKNTEDYYDYNTEVATSQVLLYDFKSQKWDYGTSFPESIQGACGGSIDNMIIVTGGKNDRECSYGTDNVWIKKDSEWMKGILNIRI